MFLRCRAVFVAVCACYLRGASSQISLEYPGIKPSFIGASGTNIVGQIVPPGKPWPASAAEYEGFSVLNTTTRRPTTPPPTRPITRPARPQSPNLADRFNDGETTVRPTRLPPVEPSTEDPLVHGSVNTLDLFTTQRPLKTTTQEAFFTSIPHAPTEHVTPAKKRPAAPVHSEILGSNLGLDLNNLDFSVSRPQSFLPPLGIRNNTVIVPQPSVVNNLVPDKAQSVTIENNNKNRPSLAANGGKPNQNQQNVPQKRPQQIVQASRPYPPQQQQQTVPEQSVSNYNPHNTNGNKAPQRPSYVANNRPSPVDYPLDNHSHTTANNRPSPIDNPSNNRPISASNNRPSNGANNRPVNNENHQTAQYYEPLNHPDAQAFVPPHPPSETYYPPSNEHYEPQNGPSNQLPNTDNRPPVNPPNNRPDSNNNGQVSNLLPISAHTQLQMRLEEELRRFQQALESALTASQLANRNNFPNGGMRRRHTLAETWGWYD